MERQSVKNLLKISELVDEFYNCEDGLSYEDNYDLREVMSLLDKIYNRYVQGE